MADLVLARRIVDFLNDTTHCDPAAIGALVNNRVPCNELLGEHKTVQTEYRNGSYCVGLLGMLNGLCGKLPDGSGPITCVVDFVDDQARTPMIKGFQITEGGADG